MWKNLFVVQYNGDGVKFGWHKTNSDEVGLGQKRDFQKIVTYFHGLWGILLKPYLIEFYIFLVQIYEILAQNLNIR